MLDESPREPSMDREGGFRGADWVLGGEDEAGNAYWATLDGVCLQYGWPRGGRALLRSWDSWVADCEEGYRFTDVEFDDELRLRDVLESVLADRTLEPFGEHEAFRQRLTQVDVRLRAAFHPTWQRPHVAAGQDAWWHRGVLRRAGHDYAEYMRSRGFDVEELDASAPVESD